MIETTLFPFLAGVVFGLFLAAVFANWLSGPRAGYNPPPNYAWDYHDVEISHPPQKSGS